MSALWRAAAAILVLNRQSQHRGGGFYAQTHDDFVGRSPDAGYDGNRRQRRPVSECFEPPHSNPKCDSDRKSGMPRLRALLSAGLRPRLRSLPLLVPPLLLSDWRTTRAKARPLPGGLVFISAPR